jgi:hypothetical protein
MSQSYGRILFVLAGIALAVYFAWKVAVRIDAFFFPWADEKSARPLLIGGWLGTYAPQDAQPLAMQMELHRWREDREPPCGDCQSIEGLARTCDEDGVATIYRVSGAPLDRAAKHIRLRFRPQAHPGLINHEIVAATGEWAGLTLRLALQVKDVRTTSIADMKRGNQASWKSQCEALRVDD